MRSTFKKWISTVLAVLLLVGVLPFRGTQTAAADSMVPKVSVIIPVYNSELYLRECLDSVVNQTLKELQIICINDGSTDGSLEILREYEKNDPRVIVIGQENQGVSAARNTGLEVALQSDAEYITFVDSDDYIDLSTYEVAYAEAVKKDCDILSFGVKTFPYEVSWVGKPCNYIIDVRTKAYLKNCPTHGCPVNRLYKKNLISDSNTKFEKMEYSEDLCFNFMIRPYVKRMAAIDNTFYYYRQHSQSILHKKKVNAHLSFNMVPLICNKWREAGAISGNESYLLSNLLIQISNVVPIFNKANAQLYRKYAKEILNSFGSDVYNSQSVSKLSPKVLEILRKLEGYAKESDA